MEDQKNMLSRQLALLGLFIFHIFNSPLQAIPPEVALLEKSNVLVQDYQVTTPLSLICPQRADIMAKYIYAKLRDWEVHSDFGMKVYYRHLQVWNNFSEVDSSKRHFEDFVLAFNAILDSIKNEGYKKDLAAVSIGDEGVACNGAHRLAACLLFNKAVATEKVPSSASILDFKYFKELGLEEKYLDAMAIQYCDLQPHTFVMVIYPAAQGKDEEVEQIIGKHAKIVYKKRAPMTQSGGFNFILTAYENKLFVREGRDTDYLRAKMKTLRCFPSEITEKTPLKIYLLEGENLEAIVACKSEIRALFNIKHSSVHSTDTHEEAKILARTLFNSNSLEYLNRREYAPTPLFDAYFEKYREWLASTDRRQEWFCVDGEAVFAAYGLRDCHSFNFLYHGEEQVITCLEGIEKHTKKSIYPAKAIDEIIFNPDNHFFYRGVKFCALPLEGVSDK